ncbi:MAG: sigma-E factor negative regulatory protein [Pseudomonadota bacterium]|nr:sigma-E factor negative regulatory protein [Burkholderiales bacterium]MDQ3195379.1 sigma-E factor negative regulatory protein [Pseudomonadota bacterium]
MDKISALMDGELGEYNARSALASLKSQAELREQWMSFHVIGDALRQDAQLSCDFSRKFGELLAKEPTALAPARRAAATPRRMALSAAASVAAVAMVGWLALSENPLLQPDSPRPDNLAAAPSSLASAPAARSAPSLEFETSSGVNDYLLAHQEFSPSTAIQGVAPYVRTVSESR